MTLKKNPADPNGAAPQPAPPSQPNHVGNVSNALGFKQFFKLADDGFHGVFAIAAAHDFGRAVVELHGPLRRVQRPDGLRRLVLHAQVL